MQQLQSMDRNKRKNGRNVWHLQNVQTVPQHVREARYGRLWKRREGRFSSFIENGHFAAPR